MGGHGRRNEVITQDGTASKSEPCRPNKLHTLPPAAVGTSKRCAARCRLRSGVLWAGALYHALASISKWCTWRRVSVYAGVLRAGML